MSAVIELPAGVREGNEKLIKVTPSASAKIFQLIEREGKESFCVYELLVAAAMACHTK